MGLHHSFGYLKHKLWPKERSGVKLTIWLSTTKSWELTWFPCVQVPCDILLESSHPGLQLWLRPHFDRRSACKVMAPQSCGSPNFGNYRTKNHLDVGLVERCKVYYKGEGGVFPQVRAMVSFVSPNCPWLVLTSKVFQLCTNHFMLVLCRPVWVSKACQIFVVPSWSSSMPFYPSKVLRAKKCAPILCPSDVFCLGLIFESFKESKVRKKWYYEKTNRMVSENILVQYELIAHWHLKGFEL